MGHWSPLWEIHGRERRERLWKLEFSRQTRELQMPKVLEGTVMDTQCRVGNSDGWRIVLGRIFRARSVMGRLWDGHCRDLGYPPKLGKGQDAGFDSGSLSQLQIRSISITKKTFENLKNHICLRTHAFLRRQPPAGLHHTEVRLGDAPNCPMFNQIEWKIHKIWKSTP